MEQQDYIDLEKNPQLPRLLTPFSSYNAETIYGLIRYAQPGAYVPIGEVARGTPEFLDENMTIEDFSKVVLAVFRQNNLDKVIANFTALAPLLRKSA